jgi:hypothetical protein
MPTSKWVGDDCKKKPPVTMPESRAEGILAIHATCDPPCPRKLGALERLGRQQ